MKQPEIWKPIQELDENYHVSNYGRIKSFMQDKKNGKLLKQRNMHDYVQYLINYKGKHLAIYAHRICAQYFLPNPENLPEVHHVNKKKNENFVGNLAWVTHVENVQLDQAKTIICKSPAGVILIAKGTRNAEKLTGIPRMTIMRAIPQGGKTKSGWIFKNKK